MLNKIKKNLFYFFIFSLPWQTIFILKETKINNEKFQYGTFGIYFFEIILLFWILSNLYILKKYSDKKIIFFTLFLIIYSFFSIFWANNKLLVINSSIPLILGGLSFLILQKKLLNFKKVTFAFIFSIFIQSLLAIYQFFQQTIVANKWLGISSHFAWNGGVSVIETQTERFLRSYGGMPHPNILGGFLVIAILLGIGAYLKATINEHYWRYFLLITLLINFSALLASLSRSAILSLSFGLFLFITYYLYNQKRTQIKKLIFFITLFIFIGTGFFSLFNNLFINRVSTNSRLEKKSINERLIFIKEAQKTIAKNPIVGTGLGNYTSNLIKNNQTTKEVWLFQPVHNVYLLIFSELGIVGFSLFLFIIIFVIYDFFESFIKENDNRIIFSIIIFSLLILSLFDHWLWTLHSGVIIFWVLLSFAKEKNIDTI